MLSSYTIIILFQDPLSSRPTVPNTSSPMYITMPPTSLTPSLAYITPGAIGDMTPFLAAQAAAASGAVASPIPGSLSPPNFSSSLSAQSLLLQQAMMLQMYAAAGMIPALNPMFSMYPMCSFPCGPNDARWIADGNRMGIFPSATPSSASVPQVPQASHRPTVSSPG